MNQIKRLIGIAGLLIALNANTQVAEAQEPTLSPAEQSIINTQIATLKRKAERNIAVNWSNAKKIAEFLCRPAALPVFKKYAPDADRVFLGTIDPSTLTLKSNQLLVGSGEFRTTQGWKDFTFTCELDPNTGKVTKFQPTLIPK